MEMDNVETSKRGVEMGIGVAVLPWATVQHEVQQGTLVAKPFTEGTFTRPIGLLIRKGKYLDRAAQAVLDAFKTAVASEEAELGASRH
jgi:DNA-binding transcriptional LysR family regulator